MRAMLLTAVLAGMAGSAMAQEVGQKLDVEGWTLTRLVVGPNVQLCVAARKSPDNMTAFSFGVMSLKRSMVTLTDAKAKLTDDEEQPMQIQVDDGVATDVVAYADSSTNLMFAYPDVVSVGPLMQAAIGGKVMHVMTGGKTYDFQMAGAKAAIDALAACGKAIGAM